MALFTGLLLLQITCASIAQAQTQPVDVTHKKNRTIARLYEATQEGPLLCAAYPGSAAALNESIAKLWQTYPTLLPQLQSEAAWAPRSATTVAKARTLTDADCDNLSVVIKGLSDHPIGRASIAQLLQQMSPQQP